MSKNGLVVGRLLIRVVGHQILKRKKGSNVKSRYYCVALHKPKTFFYIDLASLTTANANHTFDIDSPYGFHSQIVCHIRQRTTSQRKLSLQYRHANSQSALFNQPYSISPIQSTQLNMTFQPWEHWGQNKAIQNKAVQNKAIHDFEKV